ncbi:hypothetical protein ISCGN_005132, partial [Ixodes scapularis]
MPNLTQFIPQVLLLVIAAPTASPIAFGADVTHVIGLAGTTREKSTAASSVTWYNIDDSRTAAHRGTLPFPSTGCCLQKDLPPLQASGHDTTMPNLTQFIPQVLLLVIAAPTASPIAFGADVTHVIGLAGTTREESTAASSVTWYNIDDFRTGAHRGTLPFPSTGCCLQKDLPPLQASGHDTTMPNLTQFIPQLGDELVMLGDKLVNLVEIIIVVVKLVMLGARTPRLYREHRDAFELAEEIFWKQYRLPKIVVRWLCDELREEPEVGRVRTSWTVMTVELQVLQVLCALRFYGTGSFQGMRGWIHFPETPSERFDAEKGFRLFGRIPGVISCVDGTMVSIVGPSKNDPTVTKAAYWCRKYFYALNVMVVCDADCRIMCIDPRYPGSVHDSFVWQFSWLRNQLEQGQLPRDGRFLLGGQGANTAAAALPPHAARLPSRSGGSGVGRKKNTVVSFVSPGPSSCVRGN